MAPPGVRLSPEQGLRQSLGKWVVHTGDLIVISTGERPRVVTKNSVHNAAAALGAGVGVWDHGFALTTNTCPLLGL